MSNLVRSGAEREIRTIRGSDDDLRAMKRALANAPLGPKATLALTSAIIALEEDEVEEVVAQPEGENSLRGWVKAPRPRRSP